ncbi:MAG: hypothetical protein EHM66_00380 [Deltaproteobacteria bacterium]|nr:MAG: hypothetical protein EHM66_00380 [Deltaproteobacteria bacterium]
MAKIDRSNNSEALVKAEKEIERLKGVQQSILRQKAELEEQLRVGRVNEAKLKESLVAAYEKIKGFENLESPAEVMRAGYIEMATAPFAGMLPPPCVVNGVQVPRKVDEHGIAHEVLPVENALRLMHDGSAFKRYLVGPAEVYQINGEVGSGMYRKQVVAKRHKMNVAKDGKVEFVLVELENSEIA